MAVLPICRLPHDFAPHPHSLRDRVVLITGATGGLGRASALAAVQAGARVVLLARKVPLLEKLYDEILALGQAEPAIYPLTLEGATPRDYETLADTLESEYGRLDGIVHAAAHLAGLMPAAEIKPEEWMRTLHVNLSAPYLLTQACQPLLVRADDASVVFVLDDPIRTSRAFWGGYGVAKAGLESLVSILHREWENGPIRVHALLPAPMRTALRRMAYFGENTMLIATPQIAAESVVYLLSPAALPLRGQILDLRKSDVALKQQGA
jgi:NAD(P)-dependent dehydrogenase (short-subunit alcohol dehydrogenase family)